MSDLTIFNVSQIYLPSLGGKERTVDTLAHEMSRRGIGKVELICFSMGESEAEKRFDQASDIPVKRIGGPFIKLRLWLFRVVTGLTPSTFYGGPGKACWYAKPVIMVNAAIATGALFVALISRSRRTSGRLVFYCHDYCSVLAAKLCLFIPSIRRRAGIIFVNGMVNRRSGFVLMDTAVTWLLNGISDTFCVSEASARTLRDEFNIRTDIVHSYRLWVSDAGMEQTATIAIDDNREEGTPIRLLFVGRLSPEKGIDHVIELARYIKANGLDARYTVTVIGDSDHPLRVEVEREAASGTLQYLGRIDKPALWGQYAAHDVFIMPSTWDEGLGNVGLEAYACGVPVVGAKRGGIPEVVSRFPIGETIIDLSPRSILDSVERVFGELERSGRREAFNKFREVFGRDFSRSNFDAHERAIRRAAGLTT